METKKEVKSKIESGIYFLYEVSVKRNKRRRSEIWNRFYQVYEHSKPLPYVSCKDCLKVYPYTKFNGTAGILRHTCVRAVRKSKCQKYAEWSNGQLEPDELNAGVGSANVDAYSNAIEVASVSSTDVCHNVDEPEAFPQNTVGDGFEHLGANVFVNSSVQNSKEKNQNAIFSNERERTPSPLLFVNRFDIFEEENGGVLCEEPAPEFIEVTECPEKEHLSTRCDYCNVDFNNLALAMMHKGFHGASGEFQCYECSAEFVNVYEFWEHISSCFLSLPNT